jgi:hypothetical protein
VILLVVLIHLRFFPGNEYMCMSVSIYPFLHLCQLPQRSVDAIAIKQQLLSQWHASVSHQGTKGSCRKIPRQKIMPHQKISDVPKSHVRKFLKIDFSDVAVLKRQKILTFHQLTRQNFFFTTTFLTCHTSKNFSDVSNTQTRQKRLVRKKLFFCSVECTSRSGPNFL